jgi:hypothetical protein
MKSLKQVLEASLLDIDANLDVTDNDVIESAITQFINDNYNVVKFIISDKPNKNGKFEVSSKYNVTVKNKNITSLTNDLFVWNKVEGYFHCIGCKSLKSLEGAPKEVKRDFICSYCKTLQSLKGAPKEVGGGFYCNNCESLQSLEGAPKEVGGDFNCSGCNALQSLEGAPKEVGDGFYCFDCKTLQSLKGAPKEVAGYFVCSGCKIKFKESDVKAVSNVEGNIVV